MTVEIDPPRAGAPTPPDRPSNLVDLLRLRARHQGEETAFTFLADGEEEAERLTFGALDRKARAVAAELRRRDAAGRPVLLLYPPGLDFVAGFLGCLYAGAVAVPAYPPRSRRSLPRLLAVARDAGPAAALTTAELVARLEALGREVPELAAVPAVATDGVDPALAGEWVDPGADADTLAFLQYTSGSTAAPKGVMVSHGNLLHNEEMIRRAFGQSERSVIVGWLPLYHDMGLIGNVLQPLYLGARCVLMSPVAFLQKPLRWLRAVSRYRATTSGGPNFAYELAARKFRPEEADGGEPLDLSSWSVAFNGAEPVRAATLERFAETFAPYGFRREAFYPCYGLAEATLFVTGGAPEAAPVVAAVDSDALERGEAAPPGPEAAGGRELVACGRPWSGQAVQVVDPETGVPRPEGRVGEVWVRGPSVAQGYWRRPEATERDFGATLAGDGPDRGAGTYLRTGDLGFVRDGELFVTGRLKDLVILRGRNLYPQDLELTAEGAHPALRPGCAAAFSLDDEKGERLVVVQEVHRRHHDDDLEAMADAVRAAVAEEHDAPVDTVVLIRHGTILKTSSGKIRRSACRAALLAGELAELSRSRRAGGGEADAGSALPSRDDLLLVAPAERRVHLAAALREELARALGVDPRRLEPDEPVLLDSLAALELKGRLDTALALDLSLAGLIEGPTLTGLTAAVLDALTAPEEAAAGALPPVGRVADGARSADGGPLSYGQRALWLEHRLAPDSPAYTIALAMRSRSALDPAALRRALEALVDRHPVLGTVIDPGDGEPRQRYAGTAGAPAPLDFREIDVSAGEGDLRARLEEEVRRPFDLERDAPLRARLVRPGPVLLLAFHHVAVDLASLVVLLEELGALYAALAAGREPVLPPPAVTHADYVAWQARLLEGPRGDALEAWWRERLAGAPDSLELPTDRPRPATRRMRGRAVPVDLSPETAEALAALARRAGATPYMALLSAFAVLLSRHAGRDDLLVGSPAAGRPRPELRDVVGYLVNPLPLRVDLAGDPPFDGLIARVRETVLGALRHEAFPLLRMAERALAAAPGAAAGERDPSRNPLFQALFVLERPRSRAAPRAGAQGGGRDGGAVADGVAPFVLGREGGRLCLGAPRDADGVAGLALESVAFEPGGAQLDLALTLVEGGPGEPLAGELRYDADLFDATTAERLARRLGVLVQGVLADPHRPVSELPLLAPAEEHQLRHEWNDAAGAVPGERLVHRAFAARASAAPDAPALAAGDERLSYGDLADRVARLASHLRRLGVGPEVPVGLFAERSVELVVGMLAVLEAGGAYLPLDPAYPAERVAFMLEDAGAPVVLAQGRLAPRLAAYGGRVVALDGPRSDAPGAGPWPDAPGAGRAEDPARLAYVIYTSGSTGRPKGVQVPHGAVTNLFRAMDRRMGCGPGDRFLAVTTISFDISVVEILWTLTRGGEVVLVEEGAATGARPAIRGAAAGAAARGTEFGLFYFASEAGDPAPGKYRLLMEGARFADRRGLAAVWTPERHFHAFGGLYPNPAVTGAAVAAVTERVAVRAGSVVLPLHHPVRIAEEWAVVDNLSGGRAGIAFASGWHADDFVFYPESYERRKEITLEGVETVRRLWRGESVSAVGGSGREVEVSILPRPLQPELPVWLTAAGSPDTFAAAGRLGAGVLTHLLGQSVEDLADKLRVYREARAEAGHDPEAGHVALMLHTFVGDDLGRVRDLVRRPFTEYLRSSFGLVANLVRSLRLDVDLDDLSPADLEDLLGFAFERYFETSALFGDRETCLAMVERVRAAGVTEVSCLVDFGLAEMHALAGLEDLAGLAEAANRPAVPVTPTAPAPAADGTPLAAAARRHRPTLFQCTPSMMSMVLDDPAAREALRSLRILALGGEPVPPALVERVRRELPEIEVLDLYGPTEATVWSTGAAVPAADGSVPIGRPLANNRLHVVDARGGAVPSGVPGELWIGGGGVTRGYRGRPGLTAERFVPDPFGGRPGERLYRTGDRVRWRADGLVDHLGRLDFQVKVRGNRIELGEIEAVLAGHPAVAEAVAVARRAGEGDVRLVAYVVPADATVDGDTVLAHARRALPAYMVPGTVVVLDELPLTPNGKVDRRALPAPAAPAPAATPPRNPTEARLAEIWCEVLGLEDVGVEQSFFRLGGHSLLATRLAARIGRAFGVELPLRVAFERPTIAALAEYLDRERDRPGDGGTEPAAAPVPVPARKERRRAPLSFAQERLWFLERLAPGDAAYHDRAALCLRGSLDLPALARALAEVVRRHGVLRTTYRVDPGGGGLEQVVARRLRPPLPVADLSALPAGRRETEAGRLAAAAARSPFDLERGPVARFLALRLEDDDHLLVHAAHHIASDGWSLGLLLREVAAHYGAFRAGAASPLPAPPMQYADYAAEQREALAQERLARQLGWWRERLAGAPALLDLPTDRPRPAVRSSRGGAEPLVLGEELAAGLRALAAGRGATLFAALLAGWGALLSRYAGADDLVVGTPVAGRTRPEHEGALGCFVNTLPLRLDLSGTAPGGPAFGELVERAWRGISEAQGRQDLPFERLVRELEPERDLSRTPLFQAAFVLQEAPPDLELAGLEAELRPLELGTAKFDLTLELSPAPGGGLAGRLEYSRDLFDATTARAMARHLRNLLTAAVAEPERGVRDLPWVDAAERRRAVARHGEPEAVPLAAGALHRRFERHAAATPDAVAVTAPGRSLTYGALGAWAERLARRLRAAGVEPETLVALYLDRSPELVAAILGTLEAGGAYLALDPAHPRERHAFTLADAGARVVVTSRRLEADLPELSEGTAVVAVDHRGVEEAGPDLPSDDDPDRLAYCIYTSGSTGRPKGTLVSHGNVLRLLTATEGWFEPGPEDAWTLFHSPAFDFSVWELWGALAHGGRVVVVPAPVTRAAEDLHRLLADERVTVLDQTPSAFRELVRVDGERPDHGLALRWVIFGGEAVELEALEPWLRRHGDRRPRLVNMYGITETTVHVTYRPLGLGDLETPWRSPVGRPIPDLRTVVLDPRGEPVPEGVPGELRVGGAGVCRGYLGRPALTAERFVPDPFSRRPGSRLYRSGDLVRARPGGDLDYLGRIDQQVKIRGFRVELGEIEAALARHDGVRAAAVVARGDGAGRSLAAYVVPAGASAPPAPELRRHLERDLPPHMVPVAFVELEALPLTVNGKLDRRALPEPPAARPEVLADHVPPEGPVEEGLAAIWSEVVGVEGVGATHDFFQVGGHSLSAAQAVLRVRERFGVDLPVRALFETPTVRGLARRVAEAMAEVAVAATAAADGEPPLVPVPRPAPGEPGLPLSFSQERLWFLEQMDPGRPVYNVAGAARVEGALDPALLAAALAALVRRHEGLRTVFPVRDARPVQEVLPPAAPSLPVVDLSDLARREREEAAAALAAEEARLSFDLEAGPLLRTRLLRLGAAEHVILVTLHHIVSDGLSIAVFLREMGELYGAAAAGVPADLPELGIQYADYAVWQRRRLSSERLAARLERWRERLAGAPALLEVPADRPRPPRPSQRGVTVRRRLGRGPARALAAAARDLEATPFMLLLATLNAFLRRSTGQDDLVVGSPAANRERVEAESLIGFFVNTVLLRVDAAADPAFADLVERAREAALDAFADQDLPFEKLVEALQPARDPSYSPLFQVMLVTDRGWGRAELPGLTLEPFLPDAGVAKFDLTFLVREGDDSLDLSLEAALDLFDPATAARMLGHLATLLEAALASPGLPVSRLPLMAAGERAQVLGEWHGPRVEPAAFPGGGLLLHRAVARWAAEAPDAVAVSFAPGDDGARRPVRWTYRELHDRAGRLARHLAGLGVGPDVLVGLAVERSAELVLGVLAVLRAGGAWLPLDPSYPPERLRFMVDDARPRVLLTGDRTPEALSGTQAEEVRLDRWGTAPDARAADPGAGLRTAPRSPLQPEHLAYVIYTSGSTGRPKGVALSHRGLVNLCAAQAACFAPEPGDRVIQFAPASFDASVFEIAMALRAGAEIHLADRDALLPGEPLVRLLRDHRITNATLPPSALGALPPDAAAGLPALATLIVAGEACPPGLARRWGADPGRRFFNAYGPTETTVWATVEACADPDRGVTIGRPAANVRVHLRDRDGAALPVGVPGELQVGGPGLARGYLRRPGLTAERFVPDPFAGRHGEPGARLYRTGDLARRLPDGRIDFLGRLDHQVKVRGFRIELGEIEAVLAGHPAVAEAVAVARGDGPAGPRLVGYVARRDGGDPEGGTELDAGELRRALAVVLGDRLPDYMVPSALVVLDELPRTPAGKVDRAALPAPSPAGPAGPKEEGSRREAPRGPVEALVAEAWEELLELPAGTVTRDASFFDLGGHSLLATRVVSRLREATGVELPVRRLFERPALADLAAEVEARGGGAGGGAAETGALPPLEPVPRTGPPPLSFAQERMWFLDQLQPGNVTYNLPTAVRLAGRLEVAAFRAALDALVARHETLRTTFAAPAGEPVQGIAPELRVPVPVVDLAGIAGAGAPAAEARRLAAREAATPFDLATGPLLRATLVRLGPGEHVLLLDMHHAVSDGWSVGVLVRELGVLYGAAVAGRSLSPPPLPPLPVQYADYAAWQRSWLTGEALEEQIAFWREALAGLPDLLELPTDRPRPAVQSYLGGIVPVALGRELTAGVARLAREREATPFMVLLAAFQALLGRYAGQSDLAVGSPVANRTHAAVEGLIGFFVNTLVLRADLAGRPDFATFLDRARETALAAYAHQDLPFEKLVEELRPGRSLAHSPLFQVMLVLQTAPLGSLELPGLELELLPDERPAAKFDLTLTLMEGPEGLGGTLEFRRDLFDRTTAERMAGHLRTLLAAAVEAPEVPVTRLPLLTPGERRQVREWNDTARALADAGADLRLHRLVAEQAARTPERVAVVAGAEHVSFAELRRRGFAVAARLDALGVGPESRVAVCAERSVELVVALLGILEAGAAWVPLDPSYPAERLAYMLEDASVPVLVARRDDLAAVPDLATAAPATLFLDDVPGGVGAEPDAFTGPATGLDALAYVIYTSGSTGRPKGAMNAHRGVANRVLWMRDVFRLGDGECVLQKTPFSFDVSVWEMFVPLASGGRLVMARPEGHRDPDYLVRTIVAERVTLIDFVPSMLQAFVDAPGIEACSASLRRVVAGGEALPPDLARRFLDRVDADLYNFYGPTETAIEVTHRRCRRGGEGANVPIGRPIANTRIHVVDPEGAPTPVGVPGELLIAGAPVGRGYLDRPALTAERFVPDPFAPAAGAGVGARLYRSGDLARLRLDGAVEFLGRLDHQVKVRGFRIELGEIEAALEAHPDVREAVVVARGRDGAPAGDPASGGGDVRLAAYLVPAAGTAPSVADLRAHLAESLPDYMVPAAFTALDGLPLTPSGKADRRALPEPRWHAGAAESEPVAPRTPAEELVAGVWAQVLGVETVGVEDDFFALGGHSLLGTRLVARLREAAGVDLPLMRLFEAPTVAGLARAVEEALAGGRDEADAPPLRPLPRGADGRLPLSPAQERLWFLDRLVPESPWYNVPAALRLCGSLDTPALVRSLGAVVARHEALRTVIGGSEDEPVQQVRPPARAALPVVDLSALASAARRATVRALAAAEARRPFDLARGPLFRATLLRLSTRPGAQEHVLLLTLHHIVSDGWSVGVFLRELSALYGALRAGEPRPPLPALPVQYGDYAAWQRARLAEGLLARQIGYWRERLAGAPPVVELPSDRPRPPVQGLAGGRVTFRLSEEVAAGLRRLGRTHGATLFMTLLAAFDAWLARHGAGRDLVVGSPVAGRDRTEVEGLIGFFVNLLPLRVELPPDPTVPELLAAARRATLEGHAHREVPFEKLVEELRPARDTSYAPIVQVALALEDEAVTPSLAGLEVEALELESGTAKFDLNLSLQAEGSSLQAEGSSPQAGGSSLQDNADFPHSEHDFPQSGVEAFRAGGGGLAGVLEYNRDLFDPSTARRLAARFVCLATGLARAAGDGTAATLRLSDLSLLSAAERQQAVVEWNDRASAYPRDATVHGLFRAVAAAGPEAVAVVDPDGALTYGELAARADRLARRLRRLGVGPEAPVGLAASRCRDLAVAMVGILEAGGVYVPLDAAYPPERLAFMAADTELRVVVAGAGAAPEPPAPGIRVVRLDEADRAEAPPAPPAEETPADALAYVMYTSGSTGRPKGVAIPHRGIVRLVRDTDYLRLAPGDRVVQAANPSFDAATFEIWGALLSGATLVAADREVTLEPADLAAWLREARPTTLFLTTALLDQVSHSVPDAFAGLRELLFGGEAADPERVRAVLADGGPDRLLNVYGPTESTTFATWHPVEALAPGAVTVPIGRPVANTTIHLLDGAWRPLGTGVPGELAIGGDGLARGYLGRPGLTAERFVPDPFSREPGARAYRTGDLARFRPGGAVEFLGRIDHQVKIRGFRIEPGEVEAALREHPMVAEAAVLVHDDLPGGKALVAYRAAGAHGEAADAAPAPDPHRDDLRDHLRGRLPDFMVPSFFVAVPALPLTPNGKLDRRALRAAGARAIAASGTGAGRVPPRDAVEEALAEIWTEVLGVEGVGVEEDFFDLGGHSLLATRLASRVRSAFGVEIPLRALFERPTVAGLAALLRDGEAVRDDGPPLVPVARDGDLPLSFSQRRLWFLDRLEPGSALYDVAAAFRCAGPLRPGLLARALSAAARRHEALRTTFPARGGEPVQVVAPPRPVPLPVVDLSGLPAARRAAVATGLAEAEARRPFDLARGPLLRAFLARLDGEDHLFVINQHHIVSDGASVGVLVRELAEAYGAFLRGEDPELPPLPVQYADYAAWERRRLEGGTLDRLLRSWRARLEGVPPLDLPTDRPRPAVQTYRGDARGTLLGPELTGAVHRLARREGATLYMVLLAAFQALLARSSGQEDFAVGTPVGGRPRRELEGLVGFFVNTLALRADLSGDPSFADLVGRARDHVLDAFAHQELPFERLVEELSPERDLARPPVFQVAFALQETPAVPELPGLSLAPVPLAAGGARFELGMTAVEGPRNIELSLGFNTDLFEAVRIDRMLGHLRRLLEEAVAHPERALSTLRLLGAAERHQVLAEWNDPARGLPLSWSGAEPPSPVALFVDRAARTPDAVALVRRGAALTYGALESVSRRVAATLRRSGVGPEVVVGVSVERSFELVATLLAVLRAGGAYLPLDPSYPADRLEHMMVDSGLRLLVTDRHGAAALPAPAEGVRHLRLEDLAPEAEVGAEGGPEAPATGEAAPDAAAYVIYTSGSTGEPKGVVGTRRALGSLLDERRRGTLSPDDRVAHKTPVSFDASIFEVFSPLVTGGTGVLARPGGEQDAAYLVHLLAEERVTSFGTTPSMLATLLEQPGFAACRSLRRMAAGSEAVPAELAQRYRALGLSDLFNLYGPTETTVAVLEWRSRGGAGEARSLPVGRPVAGARAYLLDPTGGPVPVGVPGELVIGGPPLARGYLGRPAATAERYRPDPFAGPAGARMYRTGDLARRRGDGAVEFLGRIDRQVKVRGFRIELAEVEEALLEIDGVREAVVVAREAESEATRRLVAYLGTEEGADLDAEGLRDRLARRLPAFMVPSAFVGLAELPLTPSGKVDRRALEALEPDAAAGIATGSAAHVAPRDALEAELAELWRDVLGLDRVGVRDDFFALGGHSLLAVRLMSRIAAARGRELPLATLFQAPTVERLAAVLRGAELPGAAAASLVALPSEGAASGSRPPLFLVHAIGGSVFAYRELAERLRREDLPVYGLQARGLAPGEAPHGSVEEMAEAYLEAVTAVQDEGPYRLGGWSFGALVAYEMSRRLAARGETVELLVLVDPARPGEGDVDPVATDPDRAAAFLGFLARDLAALAGAELDLPARELEAWVRGDGPEAALDRVLAVAASAGALPPEVAADDLRRIASVYRANAVAAARYRPAGWTGPAAPGALALVAAGSPAAEGLPRWRELIPAGVAARRVPGDHYTLLREPAVAEMARTLEEWLDTVARVPRRARRAVPAEE